MTMTYWFYFIEFVILDFIILEYRNIRPKLLQYIQRLYELASHLNLLFNSIITLTFEALTSSNIKNPEYDQYDQNKDTQ